MLKKLLLASAIALLNLPAAAYYPATSGTPADSIAGTDTTSDRSHSPLLDEPIVEGRTQRAIKFEVEIIPENRS